MDRQDIDALLIGALYGELTAADEVRLAAHLESHPTDRGALDDLKSTRQTLRESRFFELQLDPPQAVSALLLQEAHRRAPKRVVRDEAKEGWFAKFTRVFVAHPAMAAATTLVLVIGVAGTLYLKKGDQYVERKVSSPVAGPEQGSSQAALSTPTADAGVEVTAGAGSAAGSGFDVRLDEGVAEKAKQEPKAEKAASDRWREQQKVATERQKKGITVGTKGAQPKDLETGKSNALGFDGAEGRAAAPAAQPSPPPPPSVASTTTAPKPAKAAEATVADNKDSTLFAWAKQQHAAAISATNSGDCARAANFALAVLDKSPDYYTKYMASDRNLKGCAQYIAGERDKQAEQRGKSRASKRTNADEAYEPAPAK